MAKLTQIIKNIIMGFFLLYGYNILVPSEALITINIFTVFITSVFGVPGLVALIVIRLLIY